MENKAYIYRIGGKVKLNSGGPDMTIMKLGHRPGTPMEQLSAQCQWVDDGGKLQESIFLTACLTPQSTEDILVG
jgi:uncharacterized protein YodC (DUF2158 family)